MTRLILAASVAIFAMAAPATALPITYLASAFVVAENGSLDFADGTGIRGEWTIDTDFSQGVDENDGVSSPTYDVFVTFDISSFASLIDASGTDIPGQNVTTGTTALFYNDDTFLSQSEIDGVGLNGFIAEGTYDTFELNAANTIGVPDPDTGEVSPAAPPGEGEAVEVILTVLTGGDWFTGAPTELLAFPEIYTVLIGIQSYDEAGTLLGSAYALDSTTGDPLVTTTGAGAGAAVPIPAAGALLAGGLAALGLVRRRRARAG